MHVLFLCSEGNQTKLPYLFTALKQNYFFYFSHSNFFNYTLHPPLFWKGGGAYPLIPVVQQG